MHTHLPHAVHREKMMNPYRGGTADMWYSARRADLWAEYKYIPRIPRTGVTPQLSPLQTRWISGRYREGRNVVVIVGSPAGGIVLEDMAWENTIPQPAFEAKLLTRKSLADWITNFTLG